MHSFLSIAEDAHRAVPSPTAFPASDAVLDCVCGIPNILGKSHVTVRKILWFKNAAIDKLKCFPKTTTVIIEKYIASSCGQFCAILIQRADFVFQHFLQ